MDIDTNGWGLSDWKQYAQALRVAHQSALDGWGITVGELEATAKLVEELRDSNETLRNNLEFLQNAILLTPVQPTAKRGRGRPKKHGEFDFALWYESECLPKFREQNTGISSSVQKVLTWYFQEVLRARGLNPLKANDKDYQGRLKTMANLISDQRHPSRSRMTS